MARTNSNMVALGTPAPPFSLFAVYNPCAEDGRDHVALADFDGVPVVVVVFTCNHCPYARHVEPALLRTAWEYGPKGVAFIAISANDPATHPGDSPEAMADHAREADFPFPYLFDKTQEVARAYGAACTPDVFVYGPDRLLAYRGRIDATRPDLGEPDAADLRRALDETLAGGPVTGEQHPSMGCNIKWKP